MFEWFSHVEIFQFILPSNSKTKAPVLSTCRAQFCRPRAFVLFSWHLAIAITNINSKDVLCPIPDAFYLTVS